MIFSSWALSDFSKSSCFFSRASTLSRESPRSSFSRKAWTPHTHRCAITHLDHNKKYTVQKKLLLSFNLLLVCSSNCPLALCLGRRAAGPCTARTAVCAPPTAAAETPSPGPGPPAAPERHTPARVTALVTVVSLVEVRRTGSPSP